jgi:hypothetical protein
MATWRDWPAGRRIAGPSRWRAHPCREVSWPLPGRRASRNPCGRSGRSGRPAGRTPCALPGRGSSGLAAGQPRCFLDPGRVPSRYSVPDFRLSAIIRISMSRSVVSTLTCRADPPEKAGMLRPRERGHRPMVRRRGRDRSPQSQGYSAECSLKAASARAEPFASLPSVWARAARLARPRVPKASVSGAPDHPKPGGGQRIPSLPALPRADISDLGPGRTLVGLIRFQPGVKRAPQREQRRRRRILAPPHMRQTISYGHPAVDKPPMINLTGRLRRLAGALVFPVTG